MYLVKEIRPEVIKDIAEMLDMGMICFYHKPSGEMDYYPDEMKDPGFDEEPWAEVIGKIKKNRRDYIKVEGMDSREAFKLMEDFITSVDHLPTHNKFIDAISNKKPFRNFNDLLQDYPDIRQEWFAYKLERHISYVKDQIRI